MLRHGADAVAGHLDQVAGDDLAGVLEDRLDLVADCRRRARSRRRRRSRCATAASAAVRPITVELRTAATSAKRSPPAPGRGCPRRANLLANASKALDCSVNWEPTRSRHRPPARTHPAHSFACRYPGRDSNPQRSCEQRFLSARTLPVCLPGRARSLVIRAYARRTACATRHEPQLKRCYGVLA